MGLPMEIAHKVLPSILPVPCFITEYGLRLNPDSFDGRGNYSLGIREQIIFPEIDYDSINLIRGLDVAITTTAINDDQARALLTALGMPFAADGGNR